MRGTNFCSALAAVALAASLPAHAVNKCTGPDGRVVYQDGACSSASTSSQEVKTWNTSKISGAANGTWEFERNVDELTGKRSCLVVSPMTSPKLTLESRFIPVYVIVAATPSRELIGVRTGSDSDSFHNNLDGMGVKADKGTFVPLAVKVSSHVLGVLNDAALIADLTRSQYLTVRARFWPYDRLHDLEPISTSGFTAALKQARSCAAASATP